MLSDEKLDEIRQLKDVNDANRYKIARLTESKESLLREKKSLIEKINEKEKTSEVQQVRSSR